MVYKHPWAAESALNIARHTDPLKLSFLYLWPIRLLRRQMQPGKPCLDFSPNTAVYTIPLTVFLHCVPPTTHVRTWRPTLSVKMSPAVNP